MGNLVVQKNTNKQKTSINNYNQRVNEMYKYHSYQLLHYYCIIFVTNLLLVCKE